MSSKITELLPAKNGLFRHWKRDHHGSKAFHSAAIVEPAGLDENFQLLFSGNPHPMFVVDRATLRFLEVNGAAIRAVSYTHLDVYKRQA